MNEEDAPIKILIDSYIDRDGVQRFRVELRVLTWPWCQGIIGFSTRQLALKRGLEELRDMRNAIDGEIKQTEVELRKGVDSWND